MSDQLLLDETNHDSCENGCANRVTQYAVQLRCPRCGADVDELKVKAIFVDEGPHMKRWMARAKGRGARILKRTSHITVTVADE